VVNYYNQLFIFTDGYLEFSKNGANSGFYFGKHEIERVRQYCLKNNLSPDSAIRNNKTLKLQPLKCDNNKFVNLYVMETDDRGLNELKGTLSHTGDLSDNNILRVVWKIWAEESGFNSFTWKPITKPSLLPKDYIVKIIIRD